MLEASVVAAEAVASVVADLEPQGITTARTRLTSFHMEAPEWNKKDTARIAVSLQNTAESAVHAEAAQQVAGAQLDASEQAVFCFAVNCIIMRTSLK